MLLIVMLSRIVDICICEKYLEERNLARRLFRAVGGTEGGRGGGGEGG